MNTTTRSARNAKSGLPKIAGCRRHPVILAARRSLTNAISVLSFPRGLIRAMISERFAAVNTSGTAHDLCWFCRCVGERPADLQGLTTDELGRQSIADQCGGSLFAR